MEYGGGGGEGLEESKHEPLMAAARKKRGAVAK